MNVVWVWSLKIQEAVEIKEAAAGWRETSRRNVDAAIGRIRDGRGVEIIPKEISCPECGYIINTASFPVMCAYCGYSL